MKNKVVIEGPTSTVTDTGFMVSTIKLNPEDLAQEGMPQKPFEVAVSPVFNGEVDYQSVLFACRRPSRLLAQKTHQNALLLVK